MNIIDLTLPSYTEMETYPGDPETNIDIFHTISNNSWELRKISIGSHTGTHVDAFSHMHESKENLDEIPLERFIGKAQVVSLTSCWPQNKGLFFTEEVNLDFGAKILKTNPGFIGGNITEDLERFLLKNNILTYTNLTNLNLIPKHKDFIFIGLPLKIKNGDGSPVRAVAIID